MADVLTELDRRHTLVMRANRVKQSASFALKRLEQQSSPPQWLVHTLRGILELADPLPAELMRWRDAARPADARPAQETRVCNCPPERTTAHLPECQTLAKAVPPGQFWRLDRDPAYCRHCGEHYDKHLHTDEASLCPTANR